MPELPDLEVFKGNIYKRLTSKRLVNAHVFNLRKVTTPQSIFASELAGRELTAINRFGKELLFDFADGKIVTAHLMLSGHVTFVTNPTDLANTRYKIFALEFENETMVFSDMGELCTIKYKPQRDGTPDAFGDDFTPEYFQKIAQKKAATNIKAFLIDQKVVKGIGNAYADEILWHSRISPHCLVGKVPDEKVLELYNSIGTVLKDAVQSIKSIAPDIISGEERSFLQVHTRKKKQTATGFPIIIERVASKTTYFTKEQVLY